MKIFFIYRFLHPVSDAVIVKDYKAKIENPIDLGTMSTK